MRLLVFESIHYYVLYYYYYNVLILLKVIPDKSLARWKTFRSISPQSKKDTPQLYILLPSLILENYIIYYTNKNVH